MKTPIIKIHSIQALLFFSIFFSFVWVGQVSSASPQQQDSIFQLNNAFRTHYAKTRLTLLEQSEPIIIVRGDRLILLDGGKRMEGTIVDRAYHDLKSVAHAPLAIYSILVLQSDGKISDTVAKSLRELVPLLEKASNEFEQRLHNLDEEQRQKKILADCIQFVAQLLHKEQTSKVKLREFVQSFLGPMHANLESAARYRIDNYHNQILKWRPTLDEEKWSKLIFLIPGSPMAREDNLAVQYCAKLIGSRGEGPRIIYAESIFDETAALSRLGTHILDTQIGRDVFSDPWRMHRDALATAAARYLDTLNLD